MKLAIRFFSLLAWQKRDEPCVIKVKLETRTHSTNLMMSIENEIQLMEIKQNVQNIKRNETNNWAGKKVATSKMEMLFFSPESVQQVTMCNMYMNLVCVYMRE